MQYNALLKYYYNADIKTFTENAGAPNICILTISVNVKMIYKDLYYNTIMKT